MTNAEKQTHYAAQRAAWRAEIMAQYQARVAAETATASAVPADAREMEGDNER